MPVQSANYHQSMDTTTNTSTNHNHHKHSHHHQQQQSTNSPESEFDAILGQLCDLGSQIDRELCNRSTLRESSSSGTTGTIDRTGSIGCPTNGNDMANDTTITTDDDPDNNTVDDKCKSSTGSVDSTGGASTVVGVGSGRTDSPDNDSAYSDSLSMLSSERSEQSSSSSSGASGSVKSSHQQLQMQLSMKSSGGGKQTIQSSSASDNGAHHHQQQPAVITTTNTNTTTTANNNNNNNTNNNSDVQQVFVKVFTADNSAKSLLADERMSVSLICRQLAEKNQIPMDPKCSIVEHIPDLYLERYYEDNESLVENVLLWTRDSNNRLYFMERDDKYELFSQPEHYLLGADSSERDAQLDDEAKAILVDEFFSSGTVPVPEVEGLLHLKSDGKKTWKRHYFVLRASGLYYCPKGKSSKSSKDLVCLITFEMNNVYQGVGWRKKFKAPTDHCFAIKHPQIQTKSTKYIKYLCADSEQDMRLWTTGIRIAKYGRQLKDNYDTIQRDIVEADLDSLANRRSFSVCSMARNIQLAVQSPTNSADGMVNGGGVYTPTHSSAASDIISVSSSSNSSRPTSITITTNNNNNGGHHQQQHQQHYHNNWPNHRMSRNDSIRSSSTSSSSGCLSEKGSSTVSTPTMEQLAFEADYPMGTIKRKPSVMQPKIPLTNTTRNLALHSDDALVEMDSDSSDVDLDTGAPHFQCGTLKSGTLRRSVTDDRLKNRIYDQLSQQRLPPPLATTVAANSVVVGSAVKFNGAVVVVPPVVAPVHHQHHHQLPAPLPSNDGHHQQHQQQHQHHLNVDELPLPPPPQVLEHSLSTLSLNSLPPPPCEVINHNNNNLSDSIDTVDFGSSNSTTPTGAMSPVVSPKKPPVLLSSPQSPQVPPKPKLVRRLSETAGDRVGGGVDNQSFIGELTSRQRSSTLQRGLSSRQKQFALELNNTISAYGTSPRMKCGPYVSAMNGNGHQTAGLRSGGDVSNDLASHYRSNSSIGSYHSSTSCPAGGGGVGAGGGSSAPHTPVNEIIAAGSPIYQRSPVHYSPFPSNNNSNIQSSSQLTNNSQNNSNSIGSAGAPQSPIHHNHLPAYQQQQQQMPVQNQSIYQSYGSLNRHHHQQQQRQSPIGGDYYQHQQQHQQTNGTYREKIYDFNTNLIQQHNRQQQYSNTYNNNNSNTNNHNMMMTNNGQQHITHQQQQQQANPFYAYPPVPTTNNNNNHHHQHRQHTDAQQLPPPPPLLPTQHHMAVQQQQQQQQQQCYQQQLPQPQQYNGYQSQQQQVPVQQQIYSNHQHQQQQQQPIYQSNNNYGLVGNGVQPSYHPNNHQQQPTVPPHHPQQQQQVYNTNGYNNNTTYSAQTTTTTTNQQNVIRYSYQPMDPSARSPHKGPLPPPPDQFLREIQRVMDKKWKVAQTLSQDSGQSSSSSTPNQILGFRDPRYLPPNHQQRHQQQQPNYPSVNNNNMYDVLPSNHMRSTVVVNGSSSSVPAAPVTKSVRISTQVQEIPNNHNSHHHQQQQQRHSNSGSSRNLPPPPPPKRSESTHLSHR
ncbi:uncharacterized protein LOC128961142 [Oppia nitens]|uniref:uncharacterized protein LOC128961142 n=1 Tax=Oppia nitens TaxID=1686743 RepID=UPI0023DC5EE1|nr:uncharacterized protein LOC128961142 [Oppia nitens]